MIFLQEQQPAQPVTTPLGDTVLDRVIRILNYPFVNQDSFKLSVLSVLLLVAIILATIFVSRFVRRFLKLRVLPKTHLDVGLQYTLLRVVHYIVVGGGVLYALKVGLAVDLTGVAVILGFLSLGLGFGLQYIASDIVSGFILLIERPLRVNDRIKIDEVEGRVQNISIRSTLVITNENMAVIVPNSQLVQKKVVNWSYSNEPVRINIPVGVAYGSDLQLVSKALVEAGRAVKEVLQTPPPQPHFKSFGDWSLDFELRVWIAEPHKHPRIRSKINFEIDRVFRQYDIEIPFPQRDIHLQSTVTTDKLGARLLEPGAGEETSD